VNSCWPKYYPAFLNISGAPGTVLDLVDALKAPAKDNWLALNPDFHFWLINFGLSETNTTTISDFSTNMESAITLLLAAKKVPVVPHIPYVTPNNGQSYDPAVIAQFNVAIDQLVMKYKLLPAPDLYAWFKAHPNELCTAADDATDPTGFCGEPQWDGIEPINLASRPGASDTIRLWAAAATAGGVYQN
jgi:hypothetical protein